MSEVKSKTIIPKRATKTKFASSESILKEGEIALIYPDTGPGTGAAKLVSGDGATVAKNLPIAIDGEAIDELKNSLDIAKKIIPITLTLAGWKSVNGDNSTPYVQTVINEELKSSMNPDLVSMLDESATPEEQEVYNKNLAIISQGVGTVNNGSITYKIYKLPSADITIGLTRLGGVKEVEKASGVDDVKVGGVSIVVNKVAEIPEIPNKDTFVPYEGATDDVNLGSYSVITGTDIKPEVLTGFGSISVLSPNNVGMSVYNEDQSSLYGNSGIGFYTGSAGAGTTLSLVGFYKDKDQNWRKDTLKLVLGTTSGGYSFFKFETAEGGVKTPFVLSNIADPVDSLDAANKKYVDDKVSGIGGGIFTTTRSFSLPDIPAGDSIVLSQNASFPGKEVIGIVPYSGNKNIIVSPTFWNTSTGFTKLTVRVTNIGSEAIGTGYGCGVNITLRPKTE